MKVWIAITNCGDGSAYARFFKDEESAEKCLEPDDERFCEDVYSQNLPFDESKVMFDSKGELMVKG